MLSAATRAAVLRSAVPGVPLRFTPGFMLSAATRAAAFRTAVPGVPLRSTPGFMLSPATAGRGPSVCSSSPNDFLCELRLIRRCLMN